MKIGILTFHKTDNYGAMLQVYALDQYLKNLGHEVVVIDYCSEYLLKKKFTKRIYLKERVFNVLRSIVLYSNKKTKRKVFQDFSNKNFDFIKPNFVPSLDMVIIGSDQVFATKLTGYDPYFLGASFNEVRAISYAASCGNISQIDERTIELYKTYLPNLDSISFREEESRKYMENILNRECNLALDPTLLVDNSFFTKKHILPKHNDYIFLYDATNPLIYSYAKKIANRLNCKLIAHTVDVAFKNRDNLIQTSSVEEFMGYFANARLVISTSFHGCAMAISYQKDLYCINTGPVSSRSLELLKLLELEDRYISIKEDIIPVSIDYLKVACKLSELRMNSRKFIDLCLKK